MAQDNKISKKTIPIVGIGASAGGLKPLKTIVSNVPGKSGAANIRFCHPLSGKSGLVPDLLQRKTQLTVSEAESDETVQPKRIYVNPPGKAVFVSKDKIKLSDWHPEKKDPYFTHQPMMSEVKSIPCNDIPFQKNGLIKICEILRVRTGHDFSGYKTTALLRRIFRRMGKIQIENIDQYAIFIDNNRAEAENLFRDLLIGVTCFFRHPQSFENLKTNICPQLFAPIKEGGEFRAWVPGCSTGQEIYSLTFVLNEYLSEVGKRIHLKLFGTDIDPHAIEKASEGIFSAAVSEKVSQDRLDRFFIRVGDSFKIKKSIRDSIHFSVHNVLRDPPFLNLNLICCRNLLIYFNTDTQKRVLPLFYYALVPDGILMLGPSESVGTFTNLFRNLDYNCKFYKKQDVPPALHPTIQFPDASYRAEPPLSVLPLSHATSKANTDKVTRYRSTGSGINNENEVENLKLQQKIKKLRSANDK